MRVIIVLLMFFVVSCSAEDAKVIVSPLAGSWYSGTKDSLEKEIGSMAGNAEAVKGTKPFAFIMPHAGYVYSGKTAATIIPYMKGQGFERVVILAPTHRFPVRNSACLSGVDKFRTPLGDIAVDSAFEEKLLSNKLFFRNAEIHAPEHSAQIEIPFIQYALGNNVKIVPVIVGRLDVKSMRGIAETLKESLDDKTLVIASSDFTHYGPSYDYLPFSKDIPENLRKLDMGAFGFIEKKDAAGFINYINETGDTICGEYPIAVLLSMLPEKSEAKLLKYDTSGRMTNNYTNSVSYMSIMFNSPESSLFSENDKKELLKLARGTLEYFMTYGKMPSPKDLGVTLSPAMEKDMGVFVTLHENGELRGCIGEIFPRRPLWKAVMAQAVNAGLNDYRFSQVTKGELPKIEFEISALTPPVKVDSWKDIVVGKHGMTLEKNGYSAVFLPQVAPEQGWGIEETLSHLARKAGLPQDAWKEGAKFTVFEAVVFNEKEFGKK